VESPRQPRPGSILSKLPGFRRRRPRRDPADTALVAYADTGDKPPILRIRSRVRRAVVGTGLALLAGGVLDGSVGLDVAGAATVVLEPAVWLTGLWLLPAPLRARAIQMLIDAEAVEQSRRWFGRPDLRAGVRQQGGTGRSLRAKKSIAAPGSQKSMRLTVTDHLGVTRSWPTRAGGVQADYQPAAVRQAAIRPAGSGPATETVVELAIIVRYGQDDAYYLLDDQARRLAALPLRRNRRRQWERMALESGIDVTRYWLTADGMFGAKKLEEVLFPKSIHYRVLLDTETEHRGIRALLNGVGLSPRPRLIVRGLRRLPGLGPLLRRRRAQPHTPE
jgi:hypothetical protein